MFSLQSFFLILSVDEQNKAEDIGSYLNQALVPILMAIDHHIHKHVSRHKDTVYAIFRIAVGLLFLQHGLQKVFGLLGFKAAVPLFSLFGLAGVIELVGGLMIAFGLFTRIAALFAIADMVGAQVIAHLPKGLIPIMNQGELSLLYLICFLVIFVSGYKQWGLSSLFKSDRFFMQ